MNARLASIIVFFFTLTSCATTPPPNAASDIALKASIAEASYAVSRSISSLAETAQSAYPTPYLKPPPNPASYGMSGLSSVEWSGPVEPLLAQIAKAANYRLRVLGTSPGIPVLVSVYAKNVMLADILRDVGYQCGRRAEVVVFPDCRVIELRYAKN